MMKRPERCETSKGVQELQSGCPKMEKSRSSGRPVPSQSFCHVAAGVAGFLEKYVRPVSASGWKENSRQRFVRSGFSRAHRTISGTNSTLRPVTVQLWANSSGRPVFSRNPSPSRVNASLTGCRSASLLMRPMG